MIAQAMGLKREVFDLALVDDVIGIATFLAETKSGQTLFT